MPVQKKLKIPALYALLNNDDLLQTQTCKWLPLKAL